PAPQADTAPATPSAEATSRLASDPAPAAAPEDSAAAPEQPAGSAEPQSAADDTSTADTAAAPTPAEDGATVDTTQPDSVATETAPAAPGQADDATDSASGDAVSADQTTASAPATEPAATAATEPGPTADLPSFDTVRLAPDGEAVVAGRAMAGSTVDILLDGIVVGTATAGADGAFAAFLSLPGADAPRVLTLAVTRDGASVASEQQVIIAPMQRPAVEVAAGTSTAQPASPEAASQEPAAATVAPAAAPALLLSDNTGVRVLQPATPADPAGTGGVALDVISYTSLGDVLLQGRATALSKVLIYLDNAAVTAAAVDSGGIWSTGLPGVGPGIYTLRLDEVDATGKVLSRIETPFKREDRDEVAAIAAASAAADATAPDTETAEGSPAQPVAEAGSPDAPAAADASASVRVVTVQPGNTLWAIARESYGAGPLFVRVFEANRDRIRDPDLIYPRQVFEIPE
ncbi:MAG: LysM peptidoglycan-binding domain-containing protein, partial [Rhodobacterales bacterium]|nr:LysM peptidoglycan-binding domain-containing protein [Rhodobacterales bacterium]